MIYPLSAAAIRRFYGSPLYSQGDSLNGDVGESCCIVGIMKIYDVPSGLTQYEQDAVNGSKAELQSSIQKGVDFVKGSS